MLLGIISNEHFNNYNLFYLMNEDNLTKHLSLVASSFSAITFAFYKVSQFLDYKL